MSDLMIYGEIGWDVASRDVVDQIKVSAPGELVVRLNTPGGSVFDGLAIATHLRARGNVTTMIDGLAASMGSVIFLSGSKRVMAPGTLLMIHNPSSGAWGEAEDLRKEAGVLDVIADEMAKIYSEASGGKLDKDKAREMMDEETWLTPEQAIEYGFAHEISGQAQAFAKLTSRTMYRKTPKEIQMTAEPKPSLFDRLVAVVKPSPEMKAELEGIRAQLTEATAALADAAAKVTAIEAEKAALASSHAEEVAKLKADHEAAIAAAKVEAAQEVTAQMLAANGPAPLAHVEPTGEVEPTHTEKWNALRAEGKHAEAGEYYAKHRRSIYKGE